MQIHQLKKIHADKKKKRVGRGGKKGAYSGKGMKGQSSRAGRKMQPSIRELIKKFPKLRGYRSKRFAEDTRVIDVVAVSKKFENGEIVTPESLVAKHLIHRINGKTPKVKILGNEEINKALAVENCLVSKKAKEVIEKAGGKIK